MAEATLPPATKIAALLTLLASLLFLILAVVAGVDGSLALSNALVAATEIAMVAFAVVNIQAHRHGAAPAPSSA